MLIEHLALGLGKLQLEFRGLAGAVWGGKSTGAPWRTTTCFSQVGEDRICPRVAEWDVDDAVVGERAHGGDGGRFLATTGGGARDEEASISNFVSFICTFARYLQVTYLPK